MTNKRIRLPKEGLVEPEDRREHGMDGDDVEGHGFVNPAPPAGFSRRSPSSGGEAVPTDEDAGIEGPTHLR
jgi:hypothetical protein